MQRSSKLYSVLLVTVAAFVLAACNTTPTTDNTGSKPTDTSSGSAVDQGNITTSTPNGNAVGNKYPELKDPNNILSKRNVYFDLDSYVVQTQYIPLVEAHAHFLRSHNDTRVLIQGNTDERGSSEYNLALGQKRADAVKKNMILLGVSESQIESVSMGKEKPKNFGHTEEAWAENRRADILYNGEY